MSATRRAVAPLLNIQIFVFVVLSIVVAAGFWIERATFSAEFEGPLSNIRTVRMQANRAISLPYAVAATRDDVLARSAHNSLTKAEAALERVLAEHAGTKGIKPSVGDATQSLVRVREILSTIERATPSTRLTNAYTELAMEQEKLEKSLNDIESTIQHSMVFHYDEKIHAFLFIWAAAMTLALITGVAARRRTQANETDEDQQRTKAVDGLTRVIRQALDDDEVQLSALPNNRHYAVVSDALAKLVHRLESLGAANREMARSNSFLQDLQEALSLAETEQTVLRTVMRAAESAYREEDFQLITVDSEDRTVRLTDAEGPAICTFEAPEACPALSHGRTWHHRVDDALARCPRLNDDSICVTCAPVQVEGKPAAVAQLSGYDETNTRFEELEALALAASVRLSVTRNIAAATSESMTDHLTGLANRRQYEQRVAELDESGRPYTLVMADLDNFKDLNDRYGHDIGDRCLEIFADVLRDACRGTDLPCRLGGEEFVLILPNVGW